MGHLRAALLRDHDQLHRSPDHRGPQTGSPEEHRWWSIAAAAHALANSVMGFGFARFALGLGEGGNFPASIKTVAEWFPRRERAFATAVFNSGTNIGAVATPIVIPILVSMSGWRSAFVITGALGFVWLIFWLMFYHRPEEHPGLSAAERTHILSDAEEVVTQGVP